RQSSVNLPQKRPDLLFTPIVENPAERVQVGFRQWIGEEIAGHCFRINLRDGWKIEDSCFEIRITLPRRNRKMAARSTKIHQMMKTAEIECGSDSRRAEHAEAVHPLQKLPSRFVRAKKMREQRSFESKCLRPAMFTLAHRFLEMRPHRIKHGVRIFDVPGHRIG